jgi:hypothetical protein
VAADDLDPGILAAAARVLRELFRAARLAILGPQAPEAPDLGYWPYDAWRPEPIVEAVGAAYERHWTGPAADSAEYRSAHLSLVTNRIVGVGDTVFRNTARSLDIGLRQGEDIPMLRERVRTSLGPDAYRNRSTVVARTESIAANNAAAWGSRTAEITSGAIESVDRRWLAADDERTRVTHRAADGQRRAWNEPFSVGGAQLMFPGDPTGPPQETIQCRCIAVDVS